MTNLEKTLQRMRSNPRDWRIEDLMRVADRYGIAYRRPGTSHVTFSASGVEPVTVPAHKPIKAVYVRLFLAMVDKIESE